ncbi:outer membrane protein assembly factor BamB family protein [Streptomyces canus]|uniref:outer membrane protein assembly factor BamB family protein n=1 Tax=Streptomyces canus TaxID=58343 RepID=UPI00099E7980
MPRALRNGFLWAVDAVTGRRRWKQRLRPRRPRSYGQFTSPTVADGRVYVRFPDDSLWAVDAATGNRPRGRKPALRVTPHR